MKQLDSFEVLLQVENIVEGANESSLQNLNALVLNFKRNL